LGQRFSKSVALSDLKRHNVHEGPAIAPANESARNGWVRLLARQDAVNTAPKFHSLLAMIDYIDNLGAG
jgi:hypothetical protein